MCSSKCDYGDLRIFRNMDAVAAVLQRPWRPRPGPARALTAPTAGDVVVRDRLERDQHRAPSVCSTTGRMPAFPGMGYPLVPGYEAVGRGGRGRGATTRPHDRPPASSFPARAASAKCEVCSAPPPRSLSPSAARVVATPGDLGEDAVLLALAATAHHALAAGPLPELIVGHGVLGRLLARLTVALGGEPTVWETPDRTRSSGACKAMRSSHAARADTRRDYAVICDASGDPGLLDTLIARLAARR